MTDAAEPILQNAFATQPEPTERIETPHRRIVTPLPAPETLASLSTGAALFPQVNCYQPPILWDRAEGARVYDTVGNCWIDFSSTAVMTNTGHAHPAVRAALAEHVERGLLAQFSFASEIRIRLARRILELAPPGCEKVYFWTVGSEATEAALRLARRRGLNRDPGKFHVLTHAGDYHGWTLGAHQLSGSSAQKPWLSTPDSAIHHLPFPTAPGRCEADEPHGEDIFDRNIAQLVSDGVSADHVAAVFVETLQGWGAVAFPTSYIRRLREWADQHDVLLVFDEIQTGFGRTGKWFGHEHYGVRADLICVGKGLTSSLPLAAVLGPADVLDVLPPGEITTTHAAHPLSCAAAVANLQVIEDENLVSESARKGELVRDALRRLQQRFPRQIAGVTGLGLLNAVHLCDGQTGEPSPQLARDLTWAAVKRGVMLFQTNRPTIKICPPLVIGDDALLEGVDALGEALAALVEA